MALSIKPSVLALTESWLNEGVNSHDIAINNYALPIPCDRNKRRGGGVCVYIRDDIPALQLFDLHNPPENIECTWLKLPTFRIIMVILYVPPNLKSSDYSSVNEYLISNADRALDNLIDGKLLIIGDLNQLPTGDLERTLGLEQMVQTPTRGNAILDKVLIDPVLREQYAPIVIGPNIGNSDHSSVLLNPFNASSYPVSIHKIFDYRQSYISNFIQRLQSIPWKEFYRSNANIQEKCDWFYEVINMCLREIPYRFVEMSINDKPWVTPILKHLINLRYEAYRARNFVLYNHFKTKVKFEINKAKQLWSTKVMESNKNIWKIVNTNAFSSKNNKLQSVLSQFPSLSSAAEAINESFAEVYSDPPDWEQVIKTFPEDQQPWLINIEVQDVLKLLNSLKTNKSCGSDNISPRILKEASSVLAGPITHLFCLSIEEKLVPRQWKTANVIPVPKTQTPTLKDLRPISITPIISKLLEKCVLESVEDKLLELYGPNQFGFRKGSSTLLANIALHDQITRELDRPDVQGISILSIDLSRAFDRLNHANLFRTLTSVSLPFNFLLWCVSFFAGRRQRVCISGSTYSQLTDVTSGVPQGSILSPYLFAAHMGTLSPRSTRCQLIMYADDVLISIPYSDIRDANSLVTGEMDNIQQWCNSHGLMLNHQKSKLMIIDKLHRNLSNPPISLTSTLCFLGVTYQDNLGWDAHINRVCKQASQRIVLLKKLKQFKCIPKKGLIQAYTAFVLGVLEYNSPLFIGLNATNSAKMEKIRRRCHRIICGPSCNCNDFTPLSMRRQRQSVKTLKAIMNVTNILHHLCPKTLRHSGHLQLPHCRTHRRAMSFIPRCAEMYNFLYMFS